MKLRTLMVVALGYQVAREPDKVKQWIGQLVTLLLGLVTKRA